MAGIAAIDENFRGHVLNAMHGHLPFSLTTQSFSFHRLAQSMTNIVEVPMGGHLPLALFAGFGVVLFVFMFKS